MPLHRPLLALTLALALLLSVVSTTAQQPLKPLKKKPEVPYVPSHEKVVAAMLKVAKVGKNDILYDLGSGDGRVVITAAKRFGTRVGVTSTRRESGRRARMPSSRRHDPADSKPKSARPPSSPSFCCPR